MDEFERIRDHLRAVSIAHHIPGRIRLKLALQELALDSGARARVAAFQSLLDAMPGIQSIRLNLMARSCTVAYDTACIPAQAWADFLSGVASPAAATLEALLRATYQEALDAKL